FFTSMKQFYLENSYSLVTVTATVTTGGSGGQGAYRMPQPMSFYANGISSKYVELVRDAIAVATTTNPTQDYSAFNHFMLYHSGQGAETSSSPGNFIWSVFIPTDF